MFVLMGTIKNAMEEVDRDSITLPKGFSWDDLPHCFITEDNKLVALEDTGFETIIISTKEEALLMFQYKEKNNPTSKENCKWLNLSKMLYPKHVIE